MPTGSLPFLGAEALCKSFAHVTALDSLSFRAPEGRITALVGDNGSGKSTLLKILSGNLQPDSGKLFVGGREFAALSVQEALNLGIGVVYQDLSLDDCKSSAENIFLGQEALVGGLFLNRKAMEREASELLESLGIRIPDISLPVGELSGGQRQAVAMAPYSAAGRTHGGHGRTRNAERAAPAAKPAGRPASADADSGLS